MGDNGTENGNYCSILGLYGWLSEIWSLLDLYYNTAPSIQGTPRGTMFLTTTYMGYSLNSLKGGYIGEYVGDYYSY